jgi:hypothetical protein
MECDLLGNEIDWDLLSQRFPDIFFLLSTGKYPDLEVFQDEKGYFCAQGIYQRDVEKELATPKSQILWEAVDVLYVYGVGLGAYYSAICDWLHEKKERVCIFLEDDLCVLQAVFRLEIGNDLLQDPQVHFRYIEDPSLWGQTLDECALQWMSDRVEFTYLAS